MRCGVGAEVSWKNSVTNGQVENNLGEKNRIWDDVDRKGNKWIQRLISDDVYYYPAN